MAAPVPFHPSMPCTGQNRPQVPFLLVRPDWTQPSSFGGTSLSKLYCKIFARRTSGASRLQNLRFRSLKSIYKCSSSPILMTRAFKNCCLYSSLKISIPKGFQKCCTGVCPSLTNTKCYCVRYVFNMCSRGSSEFGHEKYWYHRSPTLLAKVKASVGMVAHLQQHKTTTTN